MSGIESEIKNIMADLKQQIDLEVKSRIETQTRIWEACRDTTQRLFKEISEKFGGQVSFVGEKVGGLEAKFGEAERGIGADLQESCQRIEQLEAKCGEMFE